MSERLGTLVLGGSGFLGRAVLAEAVRVEAERARSAAEPHGRVRVVATARAPAALARALAGTGVELRALDAGVPGALAALLAELVPERVINAVALADLAQCNAQRELALALNAALPGELAAWCAEHDARLVHASTDLVFGAAPAPARGFREDAPTAPISVYGESKVAGEARVLDACPAALVARLPLLYGDSRGRGRGASDSLLAALARGERARLFVDEWRSPLDVDAAARALVELAWGEQRGLLHVAGPDRITRFDLGMLVLAAHGLAPEEAAAHLARQTRAEAGQERSRPADVCLDAARARATLETPLPGVAESLGRARAGDP